MDKNLISYVLSIIMGRMFTATMFFPFSNVFSDILHGLNFVRGKFCDISLDSYFVEKVKIRGNREMQCAQKLFEC